MDPECAVQWDLPSVSWWSSGGLVVRLVVGPPVRLGMGLVMGLPVGLLVGLIVGAGVGFMVRLEVGFSPWQ